MFGEPGWIFTNQIVAGLTDFTALGPLHAFWMYESPLLVDHVVMINRMDDGFVLMGVLTVFQMIVDEPTRMFQVQSPATSTWSIHLLTTNLTRAQGTQEWTSRYGSRSN